MKRIAPYTPIQYIIGKQEFFGLDFFVNEDVFIPRPETAILVETAIRIAQSPACPAKSRVQRGKRSRGKSRVERPRILDLCTGSGNIAICLARSALMIRPYPDHSRRKLTINAEPFDSFHSLRANAELVEAEPVEALTKDILECNIVASDISIDALQIAKRNAFEHGVYDKIEFIRSDMFENISEGFDIIVSNPPYIAQGEFEKLERQVLAEPAIAIDGGESGLDFYRRIAEEAPDYLRRGGYLIMEIGFGQSDAVKKIIEFSSSLEVVRIEKDWNEIERVVTARKQFN